MIEHTLDLQPSSSETNISEQEILFVKWKGFKKNIKLSLYFSWHINIHTNLQHFKLQYNHERRKL